MRASVFRKPVDFAPYQVLRWEWPWRDLKNIYLECIEGFVRRLDPDEKEEKFRDASRSDDYFSEWLLHVIVEYLHVTLHVVGVDAAQEECDVSFGLIFLCKMSA